MIIHSWKVGNFCNPAYMGADFGMESLMSAVTETWSRATLATAGVPTFMRDQISWLPTYGYWLNG